MRVRLNDELNSEKARIAGGGKGLAIGAGVGALTGAITGRVKKGHEVKVKSGTEFGVIVNRPFSLPAYKAT